MPDITSIWIEISDEKGNRAIEVLQVDLKNAGEKLQIDSVAFYVRDDSGVNHLYKTSLPSAKPLIAE